MFPAIFMLVFGNLQSIFAAVNSCNCNNPQYETTWGDFSPTGDCIGTCEGFQTGNQLCYTNINGVLQQEPMTCIVKQPCVNEHNCIGTWSTWSKAQCGLTCPAKEVRICYQVGVNGKQESTLCTGGKGISKEVREKYCPGCVSSLSSSTKSTTTILRTRIKEETTPKVPSKDVTGRITTIANQEDKEPTAALEDAGNSDPVQSYGLDNATLAAVLGSLALICVTIIVIVIAVVRRKRKNPATEYPSYSSGTAVTNSSAPVFRNGNYETVGPALPERPVSYDRPRERQFSPGHATTIENALYQPMVEKEDGAPDLSNGGSSDSDGYLVPLSPSPSGIQENSVYSTIDENR